MFSEIESEGVSARQSGCIKVNNNWCDVGSRLINPRFDNHLTNTRETKENEIGRRADVNKKRNTANGYHTHKSATRPIYPYINSLSGLLSPR